MFNLFDILQAQAGAQTQGSAIPGFGFPGGGLQSFGPQFGLSQEQGLRAMQALLPALTMGLQRNAAQDPMGFAQMFNLVGPAAPPPPSQMDMLVKQLFGSPHLSQAVLQQAATVSGVAMPALKQMLPVMAGMVVAGIVHVMINQAPQPAPAPRAMPDPFGFSPNAWSDMMQAFLTGGGLGVSAAPAPRTPLRPAPARIPTAATSTTPSAKTSAKAQANAESKPGADAGFDLMQQMFQTGLEVQQENARAMQRLFDTFWQAPKKIDADSAPRETSVSGDPSRPAPRAGGPGRR
ncbi:DUF937 domain-containing protein [Methylobacterium sp. 37f]|uniref:DUF937 domain-containing protein n=1 Tax=Methylobacterium sp. 37f TaxID=2817058 RepID=UPI001FFCE5CA|nr:DUF937 domain-containing protein [Methylobacterium sp. 37f]MCK2055147.1 hypothetical protein [Methylobacterium sp. 37f]